MSMSAKKSFSVPAGLKRFTLHALSRSSTFVVLGAAILLIDLFTGPLLQFPIFFVIPVTLSAWFCSPRLAYALAVLLPVGRLFIAVYLDLPSSFYRGELSYPGRGARPYRVSGLPHGSAEQGT